jgi:hypothetical protein
MAKTRGPNVKTVQQVEPPRCPDCESTDSLVLQTNVQEYEGFDGDGKPYNRIVRRRTQCQHCSRVWMVRTLEFVPVKPETETPPPADTSGTGSTGQ